MLRKKNERGPRSTSSEIWRKHYAPIVLEHLKPYISPKEIIEIHSLRIFLYSSKNVDNILFFCLNDKLDEIFAVGTLPLDFDSVNYKTCDLILIKCLDIDYILILLNDEELNRYKVLHFMKINVRIDPKTVLSCRLIYPV